MASRKGILVFVYMVFGDYAALYVGTAAKGRAGWDIEGDGRSRKS